MISALGIAKVFKLYRSRKDHFLEWLTPSKKFHTEHWALRDISFEIYPGSTTAFLGVNGTGKSTLLKILARTLKASKGQFHISGNLTALIELGIGFHPEFTGRENVFLTGQLLGFSKKEIRVLMPKIEAFAEIGDYIDKPLRTYSSGMQARLAFSLATARRPEVFIVDEALSVGDAYFQQKSFNRIRQFKEQGTTILLVTHEKETVLSFCDHVILMDQGQIISQGTPQAMIDLYMAMLADPQRKFISQMQHSSGQTQTISGTGEATVSKIQIRPQKGHGEDLKKICAGQKVCLEVSIKAHAYLEMLVVGIGLKNAVGQVMYGTNTFLSRQVKRNVVAQENLLYQFEFFMDLAPGHYSISTCLAGAESHIEKNYQWKDLAHQFEVINPNHTHTKYFPFHGKGLLTPKIHTTETDTATK
jgi:lipopolysaccharide transport system ATP-binding protein